MVSSNTFQRFSRGSIRIVIALCAVISGLIVAVCVRDSDPATLQVLRPRARRIYRGQTHSYYVNLASHQYARIAVKQFEVDTIVDVFGPQSQLLLETNGSGCGTVIVSFVASVSGTFRLDIVADPESTNQGRYEVQLSDVRSSRPIDDEAAEAHTLFEKAAKRRSASESGMDEAISFAVRAASLWDETGSPNPGAQARSLAATLSARRGRWEQAREFFSQAARLYDRSGDQIGRLNALRGLARLQGHFAIRTQETPSDDEFLRLWQIVGDRRGVAEAISEGAVGKLQAGKYAESLRLETKALQIRKSIGDREGELRSMARMVTIEINLHDFAKAMAFAQEILHRRQHNGSRREIAAALGNLAWLAELNGHPSDAVSYYRQMAIAHHEAGDVSAEAAVHKNLGSVLLHIGDTTGALSELRMAQDLEEVIAKDVRSPVWKTGFAAKTSTTAAIIEALVSAHQKHSREGYDRQAFATADQTYGLYLQRGGPFRPAPEDIQAALDHDSVLLEYWLGADRSWVWCLTRTGFSMYPVGGRKKIEELSARASESLAARATLRDKPVPELRRQLASEDHLGFEALRELSGELLTPVIRQLNHRRIFVVGDGLIQRVPLAILPDPAGPGDSPLITRHEVVYLPYAGVLAARRSPLQKRGLWLTIVTDAVPLTLREMSDDLRSAARAAGFDQSPPPLQYAEREVQNIIRFAPAPYVRRLSGAEANRQAVLDGALAHSKYIHFVAHGFDNAQDPDLSGLVLSKSLKGKEDGFLRLRDVQDLHLCAELVVLSACRTARGAEPPYGGVVSLTSGFLRAGASQVLSTAWTVDDEATAYFMKQFYEKLLGQDETAALALREAQLAMRETDRWRAPYYWGGFLLYGNRR